MKALILNSGTGSRMGNLQTCKCLVELADGVTIFDLQIDALLKCGVRDIYITTGSHSEVLKRYAGEKYPDVSFSFTHNPLYDKTNYIYSIFLCRELIYGNDLLLLHGDLVFERSVLQDLMAYDGSAMVVDTTKPLPEKDFKAVVRDGKIVHIGIDTFTDAVYAQPLYKLLRQDLDMWLDEIVRFCESGKTSVYAEDAFNQISRDMSIFPFDIIGRDCFEVDNTDDLEEAKRWYTRASEREVI